MEPQTDAESVALQRLQEALAGLCNVVGDGLGSVTGPAVKAHNEQAVVLVDKLHEVLP